MVQYKWVFFSFSNLPLAQMTLIDEIQRIFKMQHAYRIIIISIGVSITIDNSNYHISMNSIEIHIFITSKDISLFYQIAILGFLDRKL